MQPGGPTQAGFLWFVRNVMQIGTGILPDDSWVFGWSYNQAIMTVNRRLQAVGAGIPGQPTAYAQAVYFFGGDVIINVAPDLPDAPYVPGSGNGDANDPGLRFFAFSRKTWNINSWIAGVIQSTSDEGTSESMVVPDAMKGLTIANLQMLKTPWGRAYLALAQTQGPNVVGIS